VPLGNYIVDFVCLQCQLIIELDGGQHDEPANQSRDFERDAWLKSQGFSVLRFWNHQVFSEWDVVEKVLWCELQKHPSPQPSPTRGEGENSGAV
jgi:adenine-specific DNA-methyltransferase